MVEGGLRTRNFSFSFSLSSAPETEGGSIASPISALLVTKLKKVPSAVVPQRFSKLKSCCVRAVVRVGG